jgi:hypothetical protein
VLQSKLTYRRQIQDTESLAADRQPGEGIKYSSTPHEQVLEVLVQLDTIRTVGINLYKVLGRKPLL